MCGLPVVVLALAAWPAQASPRQPAPPTSPTSLCRSAIAAAEQTAAVPARLMGAIGLVESGRRDADGRSGAWPWTINAEGYGRHFASKAEAVAAVQDMRARGVRSIDVGCMQVNLMHHPAAFASLDDAFDPALNARYAARFLNQLRAQTGSWPRAVAGYHSFTPDLGERYAAKVLAAWPGGQDYLNRPGAEGAVAASPFARRSGTVQPAALPPAGATLSMSGGAAARVIALPGPGRLAVQLLPLGRP